MKRILFAISIMLLLVACENEELVQQTGITGGNTTDEINIDFTYKRLSPLMFEFTNNSTGCTSYRWDFGDGMWATGRDAMHTFESAGTYTVTLTGTANGKNYYKSVKLYVNKPNIYIVGYVLYKIPYEGRYYKLVFKDDNLLPSSWDFKTSYTPMLYNSDMPYQVIWNTPKQIINPEDHEYYTVELIRTTNASNTDNDVSCAKGKLKVSEILQYKPEYDWQTESGKTAWGVLMDYSY